MSQTEILARANPPEDARATMEFEKMRFELSWRYFDFHAKQRTQLFHFFVILTPALLGGCVYLLREQANVGLLPGTAACAIGAILALIFLGLDRRNRQIIRVGEHVLMLLEKELLFKPDFRPVATCRGLFTTEHARNDLRWFAGLRSHTFLISVVYLLASAAFIALPVYFWMLRNGYPMPGR